MVQCRCGSRHKGANCEDAQVRIAFSPLASRLSADVQLLAAGGPQSSTPEIHSLCHGHPRYSMLMSSLQKRLLQVCDEVPRSVRRPGNQIQTDTPFGALTLMYFLAAGRVRIPPRSLSSGLINRKKARNRVVCSACCKDRRVRSIFSPTLELDERQEGALPSKIGKPPTARDTSSWQLLHFAIESAVI
jgi:hypothetical protein